MLVIGDKINGIIRTHLILHLQNVIHQAILVSLLYNIYISKKFNKFIFTLRISVRVICMQCTESCIINSAI